MSTGETNLISLDSQGGQWIYLSHPDVYPVLDSFHLKESNIQPDLIHVLVHFLLKLSNWGLARLLLFCFIGCIVLAVLIYPNMKQKPLSHISGSFLIVSLFLEYWLIKMAADRACTWSHPAAREARTYCLNLVGCVPKLKIKVFLNQLLVERALSVPGSLTFLRKEKLSYKSK